MRIAAALMMVAMLQGASREPSALTPPELPGGADTDQRAPRVAQLASSAAGLFLRLVNERLKGRIDPRTVTFVAPAGVLMEDVVLTAPNGRPVARIKRALVQVSIRALFSGDILISRIDVDEPKLLLELNDGKLNLLEALTPKKAPDPNAKDSDASFRIGDIDVSNGGFRFVDGENVTLVFDGINGHASVDVNLGQKSVVVDVSRVAVADGSVRLKQLDIPLRSLSADRVRVITDRIEVQNVRGEALGTRGNKSARLVVNGRIDTKGDGMLRLTGTVDSDRGAWPDRLEPLTFVTPTYQGQVSVTGPFKTPIVDVNGTIGTLTIAGYAVDSGTAVAQITPKKVVLKDGTLVRSGRGVARATGDITLPGDGVDDSALDLRVKVNELPLAVALAPADLDTSKRGTVAANLRVTGRAGQKTSITVAGDVSGRGLQLYDLVLPATLDGDVRLVATSDRVTLKTVSLRNPGGSTKIAVSGDVDLKGERLALQLDVALNDVSGVVTAIPKDLRIPRAEATGTITGPFKAVVVEVGAMVPAGVAWGTPFSSLNGQVTSSSKELRVQGVSGFLARGRLSQSRPLVMAFGKKSTTFQSGTFLARGVSIAAIKTPDGEDLPVTGVADVEAILRGTTAEPRVAVRLAGANVDVKGENLGQVTSTMTVTKKTLTFHSITATSPLLTASSSLMTLDLDAMRLNGSVDVSDLDLARVAAAESASLTGIGRGFVVINGPVKTPTLRADLSVRSLGIAKIALGSGPVTVGLLPDVDGPEGSLIATVAATTSSVRGGWRAQVAYAIDRDAVSANVNLRDVDLSVFEQFMGDAIVPLEGQINGTITHAGALRRPTGTFKLRIPELVAKVPSVRDVSGFRLRPLGSVFLGGRLDNGGLTAHLCGFPDATAESTDELDSPCGEPHRVWSSLSGTVNLRETAVRLLVDASVQESQLQELIPALAAREIAAAGRVRLSAAIDVPVKGPSTVQLSALVQELQVKPPGAPTVRLVSPVELDYIGGRALIGAEPARFVTTRDGFDLVIAGGSSVGQDDIEMSIDGQLALTSLKLITDEVSNAAGTASTHLKISGRFDDGVLIEGVIEPEPGARLTPRAFGQPIVFESARISLRPDMSNLKNVLVRFDAPCGDDRVELCPLRANIGDGQVLLRGTAVAQTSRSEDETWVKRFDLGMSATGIEIKTSLGRVDTSFDVSLTGDAPSPVLRGRVEVTDGLLRKDFQVRNFILTQAPDRPSAPLWETLTPFGLGGLTFDLTATMQNVRAKARINAFSIDASVRGDLRLTKSLRFPGLDGAIEVESGTVDFPRARFDILELQLQFPTTAEGEIRPTLHLSARAELPAGSAGNTVEVPVDLSLDGGFDAMQLDLSASDPARQWTRSELFAHILFGVIPSTEGGASLVSTSLDVAYQAAVRELLAPVSREVESIGESLGVDVNVDLVSGVQLQLGRRLVLEGPGLQFLGTSDSTSATANGTSSTDALRIRLLLYDHMPVGRALSAEGRFGLISDLRLSWRLYEE